MSSNFRSESAKIYQFPQKSRISADGRRRHDPAANDLNARRLPPVECGSGWYHEQAIIDQDRTRKP